MDSMCRRLGLGLGACALGVLLAAVSGAQAAVTTRPDDFMPQAAVFPSDDKIALVWQGGGITSVTGAPGAIPGALPVYVACPNSANDVVTMAAADGSFATSIIAPPGAWVTVAYDPTGGQWIVDDPSDLLKTPINAAPSVLLQVPWTVSPGTGVPFSVAGSSFPTRIDFQLVGHLTADAARVSIDGTLRVFSTQSQEGNTPILHFLLHRLHNAEGRPRNMANQLGSTMFTPTGLPIEHWMGPTIAAEHAMPGPLTAAGADTWEAPLQVTIPLPPNLPDGVYGLRLSSDGIDLAGPLPGSRREINPFLTNHEIALPPFTVGAPTPPRLALGLLTDAISADGSRGTIAQEDRPVYEVANRIATQTGRFILPRFSKLDGEPLVWRLEPYAPMVAQSERRLVNVPTHSFAFPSGSLTVEVLRPDGQTDVLGPEPFRVARSRTPASSGGLLLDNGGGHLSNALQLSTRSQTFDYQFPAYGKYTITLQASIDDVYGNTYAGGGTYEVWIAEPLDIEPAILPMTPLTVGDSFDPSLAVLPGVPADVSVSVTLKHGTPPVQSSEWVASGTANRFGVFTPAADALPVTPQEPGELLVDTVASWTSPQGVLYMGSTRWGQVVVPVAGGLLVHGRRGVDAMAISTAQDWYITSIFPASDHAQLPYHTGDVLWQGEFEAARIQLTVEDEGAVRAAMEDWVAQGNYFSQGDHSNPPPSFAERAAVGELPLAFSTSTASNPAQEPDDVVSEGYFYAGVQRPGERVRELISDDDNGTGYWRYQESYALQPGMGAAGDLPNDFKFQFAGAVFRDPVHAVTAFGSYASLWIHLPEGGPDDSTTFVSPPFEGQNGGPTWSAGLLTLDGQAIRGFVTPLMPRPGSVLETGQVLTVSAQLAPTLPARIDVTIDGPSGPVATWSGRANSVGWYHDPAQDLELVQPGRYRVRLTAVFDSPTSAGPMTEPYPTGGVLGSVDGGFDVYVVPAASAIAPVNAPPFSVVQGIGPVALTLTAPSGITSGTLHWTAAMPGWLLASGSAPLVGGQAEIVYDPAALAASFPNLDTHGRARHEPGLADTVWIGAMIEDDRGGMHAQHVTLQGPDLLIPERVPVPEPASAELQVAALVALVGLMGARRGRGQRAVGATSRAAMRGRRRPRTGRARGC